MTIHIQISLSELEALVFDSQGLALRVVLEKAMKEAGIPYTWKLSEDNPRPSQPGWLTFQRDPINGLVHITWTPEG